jgi:hypothetical protein
VVCLIIIHFGAFGEGVGIHYIASMDPLPEASGSVLAARMPSNAVSDFVEWGPEHSADKEFDLVLKREIPIEELVREYPATNHQ